MRDAGFTLIEVLAALMIFSLAIIGLTHAGTESARAVTVLDDKMMASIVADNQLVLARHEPLEMGKRAGEVTVMSKEFEFNVTTKETDTKGFYELKIDVRRKDNPQVIVARKAYRSAKPS